MRTPDVMGGLRQPGRCALLGHTVVNLVALAPFCAEHREDGSGDQQLLPTPEPQGASTRKVQPLLEERVDHSQTVPEVIDFRASKA